MSIKIDEDNARYMSMNNNVSLDILVSSDAHSEFRMPKSHKINFDSVKSIEDVIAILKGMDITVWSDTEAYESLKNYLREV